MSELGLPQVMAALLALSLNAYVLFGGADFGGGVWDLLASGPRRARQREVIAHALGPIWEANHVWLIFAIVLTFSCFPPVAARLGTVLHIPLTLMLIGHRAARLGLHLPYLRQPARRRSAPLGSDLLQRERHHPDPARGSRSGR